MSRQVDSERMWKVYDRIRATVLLEEETGEQLSRGWDQGTWFSRGEVEADGFCRTTACFAGWTCLEAGDQPVLVPEGCDCGADHAAKIRSSETGRLREIEYRARDLLGLTYAQAETLFYWNCPTLQDLEGRVRSIAGPRPEE